MRRTALNRSARLGSDRSLGGAGFSLIDRTPSRDPSGCRGRREFTVGPGEVVGPGDILIARPQGKN